MVGFDRGHSIPITRNPSFELVWGNYFNIYFKGKANLMYHVDSVCGTLHWNDIVLRMYIVFIIILYSISKLFICSLTKFVFCTILIIDEFGIYLVLHVKSCYHIINELLCRHLKQEGNMQNASRISKLFMYALTKSVFYAIMIIDVSKLLKVIWL